MDDLRDELSACKFSIFKKALQHWDTSNAGLIVHFDHKNKLKELTLFLAEPIKNIVKYDPVFSFERKKICTRFKIKGEKLHTRSFTKNKKEAEELHKAFPL